MLAVHLHAGTVSLVNRRKPPRPKGFARIRLLAAGICNTDLELQRGYYGFEGTPGHEFVGEVLEADTPSLIGKRVVGEINIACGHCEWCARGLGRHCPTRSVLGIVKHPGAMAEMLTLPEHNLFPIPNNIPTSQAVFTEPIAAACEILDQVRIPKSQPVAVLGDGKLGLLISQVLAANGAEVHLYGRHKEKMRIAQAAGVYTHSAERKLPKAAFDYIVEATGSQHGLEQAVSLVRPRGTVIMKSTVHGLVPLNTAPVIVNEITLVGSRCGRFAPALRLLAKGKLRLEPMISERMPLSRAPEAFALAAQKGVLKVLLEP